MAGVRYTSLNQWARAIENRCVSVKPHVFYLNKSLRQHEADAEVLTPKP